MDVQVAFEATTVLSYAMAHNRVPVISKVELFSTVAAQDAQVRIEIIDDEGAVSHEFVHSVDLAAGNTTVLTEPAVRLNPAALLQVRDRRPAVIRVSVVHGDTILGTSETQATLLSGTHWSSLPPGLAFEMLPAFVMPNDPAVTQLLHEAAALLERDTGSPSMQGYQSGPERVDAIARSICQAMQTREIRYAEPPASWAEIGQKVRTPAEVLEGRVGTCLDTTVVLAAALEQAGVRPLLWVLQGHAFLGYWRDETALDAIAYPDASEVMNDIDLGRMRLVETTALTKGETVIEFGETHGLALNHIRGDLDVVHAIVDVWTARHVGVIPLPVRRTADDGTIQIVEYQSAAQGARALVFERPSQADTGGAQPTAPARVQQWKNSLLDLSLRNRLINYTDRAGVKLRVPEGRLGELEDIVSGGKPIALRPLDQIEEVDRARGVRSAAELPDDRVAMQLLDKQAMYTDVLSGGYTTRMRGLAYKARTIQEETGANNLYLGLGSLSWSLDGKQLRSPLILVPVRLTATARGQMYRLELDESGGSTPNYCLLEKLRQVHGLTIPKLAEPEQDLSGVDLEAALQATRIALATKGLPFHVQETADLSILQFAKFRLWKDLDEHWPSLMANSLVRHLVETPTDPFEDPSPPAGAPTDLDALDATCPVPADASQLAAVAEAVAGRTFVLEGPPGTGKSQTITNLLTRAVAEGKRVLFVAEKRAALDVVSSRLDSVGMGAFSLDLHDKASKPTAVRVQIKQALDHAVAVDAQGLAAQDEDLRSSRRTLARYAERLHEKNPAGLSYYSARTALLSLGEDRDVLTVPHTLLQNADALDRVRRVLSSLPDTADLTHPAPDHPWGFVDLTTLDEAIRISVRAAAQGVDEAVALLPPGGPIHEVVRAARTAEDLTTLNGLIDSKVSLDVLDATRTDAWHTAGATIGHEIGAFLAAAHPGLDVATPAALELPLADIHAQAQAAEASGFFGRGKRRKAVLALLQPALRAEAKVSHRKVLELTTALVQVQGAVRGLAARADGVSGVSVPDTWNPFTDAGRELVHRQMDWLAWAGAAVDSAIPRTFTTALRDWLRSRQPASTSEAAAVASLAQSFQGLARDTQATAATTSRWSGDTGLVARWVQTAGRRDLQDPESLSLRRWIAFNASWLPLREAGLVQAADALALGTVHADDSVRAFDRGVAAASITERRQSTGLDGFDPLAHDRVVRRFTESAVGVRRHMSTAVPAQVIASRPFQASTGRGQVGELQRELAKQRRGLGVRALMEQYGDLITQVMPCVLVSPDSVARFFPVGSQTFDMVVFDEASQIRVADAVGAMGRATSVVVVGDSKQMPPTSFAEPSAGSDNLDASDSNVLEDEESILTEAVLARVPQRWLTWHYRSQDESLIAFSNQHYYENKLSSFPAPTHPEADRLASGHGLSLVRVDGSFNRSGGGKLLRTNPVEAEAIFEEIRRRFATSPDKFPSIGVVTFNQQQRAYIEALIRDSQDERMAEALDGTNGEGLFIKNLENVQGDERDVILFSTAFSVNDKGVLPLNFGPLTRAGGERRLNVAVTRARKQVILFTSFDPSQLRVGETQSVGIKHLRAYLELAAHGTSLLERTGARHAVPDRHRDEVAAALRARGLCVETDVGLSDFRVDLTLASPSQPKEPLVAVLLDGPSWSERRTVGDRDGLPGEVLQNLMRWPAVERVWMPAWLADPDTVVAHLAQVAGEMEKRPAAAVHDEPRVIPPLAPPVTPPPPPTLVTAPQPLADERPFSAFHPRRRGGREVLDALPDRWAAQQVRELISDVVATEGPAHTERVARLVAACFDLTRLNQARIDSIVREIPSELICDRDEPFAWSPSVMPDTWTEFRSGEDRPLEHISLREIGNAIVALCRDAAGMSEVELSTEALAVFGGKRKTTGISARLDAARDVAVARGRLRLIGGRYEATN